MPSSLLCCALLCILSSFAIILMGKRELVLYFVYLPGYEQFKFVHDPSHNCELGRAIVNMLISS